MSRILSILLVVVILALGWIFFFHRPDTHETINQSVKNADNKDFRTWHAYQAPSGLFKVLLPNFPQHAEDTRVDEKTKESRNYEMYLSPDDDSAYSINTITFTEKSPENLNNEFLEKTIKEMLDNSTAGSTKTFKLVPYKTGKAIDFTVENEKGVVVGRAFINGKTLYVLTTINKPANKNEKSVEYFFNSFELTPNTQPAAK